MHWILSHLRESQSERLLGSRVPAQMKSDLKLNVFHFTFPAAYRPSRSLTRSTSRHRLCRPVRGASHLLTCSSGSTDGSLLLQHGPGEHERMYSLCLTLQSAFLSPLTGPITKNYSVMSKCTVIVLCYVICHPDLC